MAYTKSQSRLFSSYIINKKIPEGTTGRLIPILWSPDSASESINASFEQTNIPGRSGPIVTYSYTGARTVSVSFFVSNDYCPTGYSSITSYINAIKALEYPSYNGNITVSPSCSLHIPGIDIDGVCTSVSVEYKTDRYTRDGKSSASVSLSFIEVMDAIKGTIDIVGGSYTSESLSLQDTTNILNDVDTSGNTKVIRFALSGSGLDRDDPVIVRYNMNTKQIQTYDSLDFDTAFSKTDDVKYVVAYISDVVNSQVVFTNSNILKDNGVSTWFASNDMKDYLNSVWTSSSDYSRLFKITYNPEDFYKKTFSDSTCYRYVKVVRSDS